MKLLVLVPLALASLVRADELLNVVSFDHHAATRDFAALSEEKLMNRLRGQINLELTASYLYQSYAAMFGRADVALPGFRKFFSKASMEERDHAEKLIDYVNKRGGEHDFVAVEFVDSCKEIEDELKALDSTHTKGACMCYRLSVVKNKKGVPDACRGDLSHHGLSALQDTLAIERVVYKRLLQLHTEAGRDPVLVHILEHEYLDEQVDGIKKLSDLVAQLQRFKASNEYSVGEYMVDRELS